jgi:hypothetical protein
VFPQNRGKLLLASSCLSVCPSAWNISTLTARIFMKFDIWVFFFENLSGKFKFDQNMTNIKGALLEDLCTFMIISLWILRRLRNAADKIVEKIEIRILCSLTDFRESYRVWYRVGKCATARQATDDNILYVQVTVHRDNLRINNQQDASFYSVTKLYMFRASSLPSYQLYTWQLVCFMQVMWPLPRRVRLEQHARNM